MKDMAFEFEVNLKHVNHRSQRCFMVKVTREPRIRQDLILAHQLKELMEQGQTITIKQIAGWLGITYRRVLQIMDLLLLTPKIQEEIIFSDEIPIYRLSEKKIRNVTKEIFWDRQIETWKKLVII